MLRQACLVFVTSFILLHTAPSSAADLAIDARFSPAEITLIRDYYQTVQSNQSQRGKRLKSIPPGIAKNLARGKSLPPGIAKQVLPEALSHQLPAVREGFERVVVDGKVLLVDVATQVIHDVLTDIILR